MLLADPPSLLGSRGPVPSASRGIAARSLVLWLPHVCAPSNRARKRHLDSRLSRRLSRRSAREHGCHLSGSTPSQTAEESRSPCVLVSIACRDRATPAA